MKKEWSLFYLDCCKLQSQIWCMHIIQELLFVIAFGLAVYLFSRKAVQIRRNILLGRDVDLNDQPALRWNNVLLLALGQKKMFRKPLVAVLHFFVYAGFIIINLEILEIILDGILGKHRLFAPLLGSLYPILIGCFEVLAALVILGCAVFLIRRNILKVKRLAQHELDGWPKSDANYILLTEIVLMLLFLTMNAADQALQHHGAEHYVATGPFWISGQFTFLNGLNDTTLMAIERGCWWLHILGILAFLNYLPYSKHLHIILAFPNAYYGDLRPKGKMENMPAVQKEVQLMLQPELAAGEPASDVMPKFGAKDVPDLTWKNLLDAYSCTECGRCTAACPANITGKKLSPRKIMMDTRDRAEEIGLQINKEGSFKEDGKTLLRDYITEEELRACTSCNACVQECPVSINPLHIILQLRRHLVMEESSAPQEWNGMFSNIENNMAPWKFSPDDRDKWAIEMNS
jgi:heterodisulfide reductase subunit C